MTQYTAYMTETGAGKIKGTYSMHALRERLLRLKLTQYTVHKDAYMTEIGARKTKEETLIFMTETGAPNSKDDTVYSISSWDKTAQHF